MLRKRESEVYSLDSLFSLLLLFHFLQVYHGGNEKDIRTSGLNLSRHQNIMS